MIEDVFPTMNTVAQIKIEGNDEENTLKEIKAIIFDFENRFNYFSKVSEISKLCNKIQTGKQYPISRELYEILLTANKIRKETYGLFDVDYLNKNPQKDFYLKHNFITFHSNKTKINLGAIAKGYVADQALKRVKNYDFERIMISMGGQITCLSRNNKTWKVGLQNPSEEFGQILGSLEIRNGTFSTSAENYRGKHIINPIHMKWSSRTKSISVLHSSGTLADAYSTALFLADEVTRKNIVQKLTLSVIIFDGEEIKVSPTLLGKFKLIDTQFKILKY